MQKNQYGLTRNIPNKIRKQIRQDAYFGCIFCGCPIVEYEHIEPSFKDAKRHDPNHMTLLCPTHHTKVTKKQISKTTVKEKKQNPYNKNNQIIALN